MWCHRKSMMKFFWDQIHLHRVTSRRPCWRSEIFFWGLNSIFMQIPPFVWLCKYGFWSHERTHTISSNQERKECKAIAVSVIFIPVIKTFGIRKWSIGVRQCWSKSRHRTMAQKQENRLQRSFDWVLRETRQLLWGGKRIILRQKGLSENEWFIGAPFNTRLSTNNTTFTS